MKNKIINFLFKKRIKLLKNKNGFSLLELMVALGILTVISAIAVPQFTRYRQTATRQAFSASGDNIARAFLTCLAAETFSTCNDLGKLKINCSDCGTVQASTPNFCVPMEKEIGGNTWKGCVQVNAETSDVTKNFNRKLCYNNSNGCASIQKQASNCDTSDPSDEPADPLVSPNVECTSDVDCSAINPNYLCDTSPGNPTCSNTGVCGT